MDAITETPQPVADRGSDQFIPVRKEELLDALVKQGAFVDTAECELFWRFARTLRTICHYEYSETLDRLRDDYYYFSPEVAGLPSTDRAKSDCAYDDLIRSLDSVLKDANFKELPHEDVTDAHRRRTVPVEVKAEHDDFREVRFYRRGRHVEQIEVSRMVRPAAAQGRDRSVRRRRARGGDEDASRNRLASGIALPGAPQGRSRFGAAEIFPQYRLRRSLRAVSQCPRRHEQFRQGLSRLARDRRQHSYPAQALRHDFRAVPCCWSFSGRIAVGRRYGHEDRACRFDGNRCARWFRHCGSG